MKKPKATSIMPMTAIALVAATPFGATNTLRPSRPQGSCPTPVTRAHVNPLDLRQNWNRQATPILTEYFHSMEDAHAPRR